MGEVQIPGGNKEETKVLAYMGDLNILCQNKCAVERAVLHTRVYKATAGAKLDVSKSTSLAVGKLGDLESLGVSVPCEGVKILGVEFDLELSRRRTWQKKEAKVKQGLLHLVCGAHATSPWGERVALMKAVLLPVLLYTTLVFPPPKHITHRLQRAVSIFFWGSRMEKMERKTPYKKKWTGGSGMPDIRLFLWLQCTSQIGKLVTGPGTKTACLVKYFAGHLLRRCRVYAPTNWRLWTMEQPWVYRVLNNLQSKYGLQMESAAIKSNCRRIQKTGRDRDRLLTMELLPEDDCQAVWDQIFHKDL
ncbi:hypothetical protein Y1Q_0002472 [Alligator mississippiensis]|uniref:Reverse transcriptase domain-containing protein n=1 Tax=Alligator mississippiensis TaxID=8496 RepID=A0A151NBJ4_ALLMI|nr:hypothetical protein Y1Q_0002472 [Alligator mississippiensis]